MSRNSRGRKGFTTAAVAQTMPSDAEDVVAVLHDRSCRPAQPMTGRSHLSSCSAAAWYQGRAK